MSDKSRSFFEVTFFSFWKRVLNSSFEVMSISERSFSASFGSLA